ncbi:hypothetical protein B0H11DRAFT_2096812 [Mycena galericulata]|nr:hypothetical protein B0H11DRAFT_2096812 [Mycena galericulata]
MSSRPQILVAGALSFLQDLSNGSNIPALQPLVSVVVRIYTSAEAAKRNNKKAKALAQEARYWTSFQWGQASWLTVRISEPLTTRRALEDLSDYRMKITEAKLQFIVSLPPQLLPHSQSVQVAMEMAKVQTLQREQKYPVFTLADLEIKQTLNQTNPRYTRAFARLVPHQKLVILRTYHTKSNFNQDIESLMSLRHPNLPFLGASSLFAPAPFIVMEMSLHSPAQSVIQGLYRKSPKVLQRKSIEIDAMNHLRENDIALSDLIKQLSSIQYDGSKVILNVELPRCKPRSSTPSIARPVRWDRRIKGEEPKKTLTVSDDGFSKIDDEFWKRLQPIFASLFQMFETFDGEWVDIPEQENQVLQIFNVALPSALWPIWRYLMGCDLERRLHDLRNISEKLCGHSDQVINIPQALVATGNFPYQDFPPTRTESPPELGIVACLTKRGRLVVIHDDEEQGTPSEELMRAGSGIFPEPVGDYTRYKLFRNRPFSLEIGRTTTISLHDPAASETRRRIQEYFHRRLPSLLKENTWVCEEPTDGFVLVTSVRSRRIRQLRHNHNTFVEAQSEGCLQCIMYGGERSQPDAASNQDLKIDGIYFHAFPEKISLMFWRCGTLAELYYM